MVRPQELIIDLTADEKNLLEQGCRKGNWTARKIIRARILLLANINQKERPQDDAEIAKKAGCSHSTIGNIRKRFCLERLGTLDERIRSGRPRTIDGEIEAQITMIACSEAPEGRERWTLRLIANKLVELVNDLDDVSYSTVGKVLKKTNSNLGLKENGK